MRIDEEVHGRGTIHPRRHSNRATEIAMRSGVALGHACILGGLERRSLLAAELTRVAHMPLTFTLIEMNLDALDRRVF